MNNWLDSWTTTRKLPNEYRRSRKYAAIGQPGFKSARDLYDQPHAPEPAKLLPIEQTKYILEHGKQAWREQYGNDDGTWRRRPRSHGALTYTDEGWPIVPFCGKKK